MTYMIRKKPLLPDFREVMGINRAGFESVVVSNSEEVLDVGDDE